MVVKRLIGLAMLLTSFGSIGQQLMLPKDSKIYPDSIAIYWKKFSDRPPHSEINVMIDSPFGENYFRTATVDSVVIAPYYLVYDESMIVVSLQEDSRSNRRHINQIAKLRAVKKDDSVEALIYRVLEKPDEQNMAALGQSFEQIECYVNAMFIYYKLYNLGFKTYWTDFVHHRLHPMPFLDPSLSIER